MKRVNNSDKVSETKTEMIFRDFYGCNAFVEKSAIPESCGFKSKNKTENKGYPDFYKELEDFVIVVEAKASDFEKACSEVKFYADYNSIEKDIVAIAISGQTENDYRTGLFFKIDKKKIKEIETAGKLLPIDKIIDLYRKEKIGEYISVDSLKNTLNNLNKVFHESMKVKDTERSLFFSGLMIALKDNTFINTYRNIQEPTKEEKKNSKQKLLDAHNLNQAILNAIENQIATKINNYSKEYNWRDRFSFIKALDFPLKEYKKVIQDIEKKIFVPFKYDEKLDILGKAYKIFLSRAGKIENKNIILTPDHIKELMIELARLEVDDVLIDTCTGSGGFLMEGMEQMIKLAQNDPVKIDRIKDFQLIGFESDPTLFALACSNMFLHGDGRTNMIFESSLVEKDSDLYNYIKSLEPKKCVINPPYENNYPILFAQKAIELLEPNGKLIIIMPTPTLNRNLKNGITIELLEMAKLDFVIKMPNNLFSEQGRTVNTSIFGFTKTKHEKRDEVIFYNMEDDGLVSVQHKGRIDKYGNWERIKNQVIDRIKYNKESGGDYETRPIYKNAMWNCYGFKSKSGSQNYVEFGKLFDLSKKGSLQSENAENGEYDFITASEVWKKHSSYEYDMEAIVYAVSAGGSLGRCHHVNGKFIASNLCLVLTPKNPQEYPINLLFYTIYLNSIRNQIVNEIADGTSKLTLNPSDLSTYYLEYFPIETQNKIASQYKENGCNGQKLGCFF